MTEPRWIRAPWLCRKPPPRRPIYKPPSDEFVKKQSRIWQEGFYSAVDSVKGWNEECQYTDPYKATQWNNGREAGVKRLRYRINTGGRI